MEEASSILSKKVPLVVVTIGPLGAIATDRKTIWRQPAFDVPGNLVSWPLPVTLCLTCQPFLFISFVMVLVKDTTGAGDSFTGGFLVKWLAGESVEQALRYGIACGSMVITTSQVVIKCQHCLWQAVMRSGISAAESPTREEVERFIASAPVKHCEKVVN